MKKKNKTDIQLANIEQGLSKSEQFIEDNQKPISLIIAIIILVFLSAYSYNSFYKKPLNSKAQDELFVAEQYFEKANYRKALDGDDTFLGLSEICENYSNTTSGNLAYYYAGISHLRLGEFESAIKKLEKFKSKDPILLSIAKAGIGDAFSEIGQTNESIEYYKKAISVTENESITPFFLIKCAQAYEKLEDYSNAKSCYTKIKTDFPNSNEAKNIEKFLNKIN